MTQGYIYKITNLVNNKIYIGQTVQSIKDRFIQHKSHAKTGQSNHKLARAIRKYGAENFIIEEIEYCNQDLLNERERYWISFYNSTDDNIGYNINCGGQDYTGFYQLNNEQEIIDYYYTCHNQLETIKHFNITEYKFRQLLTKNNLPTDFSNYGKHSKKKVYIYELDKTFNSETECAQYLIDNKICTSTKLQCVKVKIASAVKNKVKVYNLSILDENTSIEEFNESYFNHIRGKKGKVIVYQVDIKTKKVIKMFDSIKAASVEFGPGVADALRQRCGHRKYKDFLWYKEEEYLKEN